MQLHTRPAAPPAAVSTRVVGALTALLLAAGPAHAQQWVFAPAADAQRLLSSRDDFVARLSPFDRAARMKTDRDVAEPEFLEFAGAAALDWDEREVHAIEAAANAIRPRIMELGLPLPSQVILVKTTGSEEGNAAYTRGNAVILPRRKMTASDAELRKLLAHELFHVASRTSPALAKALYAAIGFYYCGEAPYPADLAPRKLTNPDAPRNDYCIRLTLEGKEVAATPILFARSERYDPAGGGEFFEYMQLGMLVDSSAPRDARRSASSTLRVVGLQQLSGFFEQVGANTEYIIHPEEILADNFALLVLDTPSVPSPAVLQRIRSVLAAPTPRGTDK